MGRPKGSVKESKAKTGSWGSVHVKCPFWRGETDRAVCCEGLKPGETIRRLLPSREAKDLEMDRYCARNYEECKIFQLCYSKYTE